MNEQRKRVRAAEHKHRNERRRERVYVNEVCSREQARCMLGCDHGGVRTGRRLESSREPQISVDLLEVSTRHGWPAVRRVCCFGRSFKRPTSVWPPPSSSAALAGVCLCVYEITVEIPQVLLIRELCKEG